MALSATVPMIAPLMPLSPSSRSIAAPINAPSKFAVTILLSERIALAGRGSRAEPNINFHLRFRRGPATPRLTRHIQQQTFVRLSAPLTLRTIAGWPAAVRIRTGAGDQSGAAVRADDARYHSAARSEELEGAGRGPDSSKPKYLTTRAERSEIQRVRLEQKPTPKPPRI